jgi:hypothetical protein
MAKIRPIIGPSKQGKHVTLSEARAAFRELSREPRVHPKKKATSQEKTVAKAG